MDLTIFFSPIEEHLDESITSPSSFFKNIKAYTEKIPDFKDAHMAIFGVKDERGSQYPGTAQGPDEIRKKLYNLKRGTGTYKVIDLGNLNPGHDLDETYVRI